MPKKIKTNNTVKPFIISSVISCLMFFVLMIIFSLIATKVEMPDTITICLPFMFVSASSFIGAGIYAKNGKMKMILSAIILSSAQCLIICIMLLLCVHNIGLKTMVTYAVSFVSSFAGIYIVKNKKPKRKI